MYMDDGLMCSGWVPVVQGRVDQLLVELASA